MVLNLLAILLRHCLKVKKNSSNAKQNVIWLTYFNFRLLVKNLDNSILLKFSKVGRKSNLIKSFLITNFGPRLHVKSDST